MGRQHRNSGYLLRQMRSARGLSLRDLGLMAEGLTAQAVHLLETGQRKGRRQTWRRIARALGVPAEVLDETTAP